MKVWIPLESNPELITKYAGELGMGPGYEFQEILSLELLEMVPRPVYAVVLLFPLTEKIVSASEEREKENLDQSVSSSAPEQPFFCRQTISNACGTIAVLHSVTNNMDKLSIRPDSFFKKFFDETISMNPSKRAEALQNNEELEASQEKFSKEGETAAPDRHDPLDTHFIAFVESSNKLVELDGRKASPIDHGDTSPDSLLEDAARIIKEKFMAMDPSELRFTMMALV
ncbi:hypothetical protein NDN08_006031 [Rhodosorus marinus]|uniref:Ubiquitin carboxyl-terminal hydrolase n=1 Tax=Rhodosorus marinus TaxID=101924 RepID=A0AAV8UQ56_9RHOD|nr:hypothetical protein NDN08_006031 [Rhodosorus marinus]